MYLGPLIIWWRTQSQSQHRRSLDVINIIFYAFRVINCRNLQSVVQMPKLAMDSVDDVKWLPTHSIRISNNEDDTETIATSETSVLDNHDKPDDLETKLDEDQYSMISVSSDLDSFTFMSSIEFSEVKPFVSSDEGTLVGSDVGLDLKIDSNLDTDTDEGSQDVNMSSEQSDISCQTMH